jgi:hypothetical protein
MRIGDRILSVRRVIVLAVTLGVRESLRSDLADRDSEIRQMIARIVRSVAKDHLGDLLESETEIARQADGYVRAVFAGRVDPAAPHVIQSIQDARPGLSGREAEKS